MKRILSAALALTTLSGAAAMAQGYDQGRQGQTRSDNTNQGHDNDRDHQRDNDRGQQWSRGDRVPDQYRRKEYVVTNWHGNHLRKPPHGYHWVRNDNNDYFLAAVATGVIADVVLHSH